MDLPGEASSIPRLLRMLHFAACQDDVAHSGVFGPFLFCELLHFYACLCPTSRASKFFCPDPADCFQLSAESFQPINSTCLLPAFKRFKCLDPPLHMFPPLSFVSLMTSLGFVDAVGDIRERRTGYGRISHLLRAQGYPPARYQMYCVARASVARKSVPEYWHWGMQNFSCGMHVLPRFATRSSVLSGDKDTP